MQKDIASLLEGRILVGHAVHNDLKVLKPNSDGLKLTAIYSECLCPVIECRLNQLQQCPSCRECNSHCSSTVTGCDEGSVHGVGPMGGVAVPCSLFSQALMLSHPWRDTRDTSKYKPFKTITRVSSPISHLICCCTGTAAHVCVFEICSEIVYLN